MLEWANDTITDEHSANVDDYDDAARAVAAKTAQKFHSAGKKKTVDTKTVDTKLDIREKRKAS